MAAFWKEDALSFVVGPRTAGLARQFLNPTRVLGEDSGNADQLSNFIIEYCLSNWPSRIAVIKASNFASHGNFGHILASTVAFSDEPCIKDEENRICVSEVFPQLSFSSFFPFGCVLLIASPSSSKFTRGPELRALMVSLCACNDDLLICRRVLYGTSFEFFVILARGDDHVSLLYPSSNLSLATLCQKLNSFGSNVFQVDAVNCYHTVPNPDLAQSVQDLLKRKV